MIQRTFFLVAAACLVSRFVFADEPPRPVNVERQQIGQMTLEGIPPWSDGIRTRMLQYLSSRAARLLSISDDGQALLISTRFGTTGQLHLVRSPMGARKQITFFDEPVGGGAFLPGSNGQRIVMGRDVGGNENTQYYILDLATGRSTLITDGKSRNESLTISPKGTYLAWSGVARNGRDGDVYLVRTPAPGAGESEIERKLLWQVEGNYGPNEFSPDETKLVVTRAVSAQESHLYLVDLATGANEPITPPTPAASYDMGEWSVDGRYLYIDSDRDGEFHKLYRYELATKTWTSLTDDIPWSVESVEVEPSGKGIAFTVNEDGNSRLYFADVDGKNRRAVGGLPLAVIGGIEFSKSGTMLGLTLDSSKGPGDAYTVSYPDAKLVRWTESEVGGLNPEAFVEPELIRYETWDTVDGKPRTIPAYYYKAPGPGPHPVVINCHGGPEGQTRPTYNSTFQYWLNELGISVICPNVRGSTGYGKSFLALDNAVKREDSVKDVGALLDWIAKQPELDAKRIGVYGGSYGGYMVLASLTNFPGRIKAGIDVVGVADFISFLKNTADYRRDLRRVEYGDERDPSVREVLEKISPLRNAAKINASLFVIHGKNDPRVPVSEAEQIVAKMRELNRPVWMAVAGNEGHGFRKRENSDLQAVLMAHFWEQQLLK